MTNFLEAQHIVKHYKNHTALDDVSIAVKPGSVFGLLGPNGAGKSTLIKIINKILLADSGTVLLDGKPMVYQDIRHIGYLPEERGLYKKMKVGEQAIYLARLHGLSTQEAKKELTYWFEKFGIMDWWGRKVEELSKGMQQKVQFICTVIHRPQLLIFDEPFSGFDPVNAELLKKEILELKEQGSSVIFSTHNMQSVEEICDDIALINKSKVVVSGSVLNVRNRYFEGIVSLLLASEDYRPSWVETLAGSPFSLIDITQEGRDLRVRLKVSGTQDIRPIVDLIPREFHLLELKQELPSMQDIFIQLVAPQSEDGKKILSYDELNATAQHEE